MLYGDPKMPKPQKAELVRGLACALREVEQYIFAPDMGTDEECMAWVKDEIDRVVGLPREVGGIPLDEIGATGWGISHVADVALRYCDFELAGARVRARQEPMKANRMATCGMCAGNHDSGASQLQRAEWKMS